MGIITNQGLNALAAALTAGTTVNIKRFFYADIPGVNGQTIPSQDSGLPPSDQIVYSDDAFSLGKSGNDSAVYSSVLLPDVGDFTFNAIGLETDKGELLAVHYQNPQQKIKTKDAVFGNRIKKYFVIRYANAANLTGAIIEINETAVDYATSEKPGLVELATAEEVNTGTDDTRAVTPKTLNQKLEDAVKTLAPLNHTHPYAPDNHTHSRAGEVILTLDDEDYPNTLILNGQAISRSLYGALFRKYGTKYGGGDGVTTFNLPNLQDEFVRGASASNPVGTKQTAQTALTAHTHSVTVSGLPQLGNYSDKFGSSESSFSPPGYGYFQFTKDPGYGRYHNTISKAFTSGNASSSAETRPRNIAGIFRVYFK